jgi:hypothetical protein
MRAKKRKSTQTLFCLGLIALATAGRAQTSDQQTISPQKPLQHEVAVTLKLIQVYVTDKNGNPATNLDKSAFRVYDNGQLQTITEFEKHMAPAPSPGVMEPPVREALVSTETAAPRMGRKFFVLIDLDANDLEGIAFRSE